MVAKSAEAASGEGKINSAIGSQQIDGFGDEAPKVGVITADGLERDSAVGPEPLGETGGKAFAGRIDGEDRGVGDVNDRRPGFGGLSRGEETNRRDLELVTRNVELAVKVARLFDSAREMAYVNGDLTGLGKGNAPFAESVLAIGIGRPAMGPNDERELALGVTEIESENGDLEAVGDVSY